MQRFPVCSPQSLTCQVMGTPSPSLCKKNSRLTLGKLRSNDETSIFFTRWIATFSLLLADGPCATMQELESQRLFQSMQTMDGHISRC